MWWMDFDSNANDDLAILYLGDVTICYGSIAEITRLLRMTVNIGPPSLEGYETWKEINGIVI